LPNNLQITADNHLAIPTSTPTILHPPLTDLVVISNAEYNLTGHKLTVVASSSDESSPPVLTASYGADIRIGDLSGDGLVKTLTDDRQFPIVPPTKVTVKSSNGGSDTEDVVLVQ
jgi:hypothetical protein